MPSAWHQADGRPERRITVERVRSTESQRRRTSEESKGTRPSKTEEPKVSSQWRQEGREYDPERKRYIWRRWWEYSVCMLGVTLGVGNISHFPALAYRNEGGTFLFVYLIMIGVVGLPIFYLEACLGQFCSRSATQCWGLAPIFRGAGVTIIVLSALVNVYYSVMVALSLCYCVTAVSSDIMPWLRCDQPWNTPTCISTVHPRTCGKAATKYNNGTCYDSSGNLTAIWNITLYQMSGNRHLNYSSEEYFRNQILGLARKTSFGNVPILLAASLTLHWLVCFFIISRGIRTLGRYVIFFIIVIGDLDYGVSDNTGIAMEHFFTPSLQALSRSKVWHEALDHVYFSLGLGSGVIITMSSFNRFHTNPLRTVLITILFDTLLSVISGTVTFVHLGNLKTKLKLPFFKIWEGDFVLTFLLFPEILTIDQFTTALFASLFFLSLYIAGITSQLGLLEVILSGVLDAWPSWRGRRSRWWLSFAVSLISFLVGITLIGKRNGYMVVELLDRTLKELSFMAVEVCTVSAVFCYGVGRLYEDIKGMTSVTPSVYWKICWFMFIPLNVTVQLWRLATDGRVDMCRDLSCTTMSWLLTLFPVAIIPGYPLARACMNRHHVPIQEQLRNELKPSLTWGQTAIRTKQQQSDSQFSISPPTSGGLERLSAGGLSINSLEGGDGGVLPRQNADLHGVIDRAWAEVRASRKKRGSAKDDVRPVFDVSKFKASFSGRGGMLTPIASATSTAHSVGVSVTGGVTGDLVPDLVLSDVISSDFSSSSNQDIQKTA